MIGILAGFLFDLRTVAVIIVIFFTVSITLCVRMNLRDRAQAGVSRTTKHTKASEHHRQNSMAEKKISPRAVDALEEIMWAKPTRSRMFDGKVIFYGPNGPIDLSRYVRDVTLSSDETATLEAVNDPTARNDHERQTPHRSEHARDLDELDSLDGDGSDLDERDPFDFDPLDSGPLHGANPDTDDPRYLDLVFGKGRSGKSGRGRAGRTDQP